MKIGSTQDRYAIGLAIREHGVEGFPALSGWNREKPLLPFQEVGVAWLYAVERGLLADQVGLGKMVQALALLQLLKQRGQLGRALILCEKTVQRQWVQQAELFTDLRMVAIVGEPAQRATLLATGADAHVVTYPLLRRDYDQILRGSYSVVIADEGSVFRNHRTQTADIVRRVTRGAGRVIILDATPIQTSLLDMRTLLDDALHLRLFGSVARFMRNYCVVERQRIWRAGAPIFVSKIVRYQNVDDFRDRVYPYVLRRRAEDVASDLPDVAVSDEWLELPPEQRRRYDEARAGVVTLLEAGQRSQARAHLHHVQMACDTTLAFGDPVDRAVSVKIDRLIDLLTRDLVQEKVIVFSRYKVTIDHAEYRMQQASVNYRRYTGDETADQREDALEAFWHDPQCQVLIGTTALERGLNLQVARYFIPLNQLWNPQRMVQLVGRLRRIGSVHAQIMVLNLLCTDTVEDRLQQVLRERSAVSDYVFEETTELWDTLTDDQLIYLLQGG